MKKLLLLLISINAWGASVDAQLQNESRILDLLRKEKEQRYIQEQLKYPDKHGSEKKDELQDIDDTKEYVFKEIYLESPYPIPSEIAKILKSYEKKKLKKKDIFELIKKTSDYYIKKGYTTTLVTIKTGNIKTGLLVLELQPGYINNIEIKNSRFSKLKIFDAFPIKKGDIFDIYAIDQGLDNLNGSGYSYQMEVKPSKKIGYSDINLIQYKRPLSFALGLNNSSTIDKGSYRSVLGLGMYDFLGLNDSLYVSYLERFIHNRDKNKESIYSINYSIPFEYWKFTYTLSYTDSYTNINGEFGDYISKNQNFRNYFKLYRTIHRSKTSKTTLYGEIKTRAQQNRINDILIEINSKQYTSIGAGIQHINRLFGGNLYLELEYLRGAPLFGGEADAKDSIYKAQYNKINLNVSWQKYLYHNKYIGLLYAFSGGGSYSDQELFYSDKFLIGDQYTVRGFKESSIALDSGGYISNTLTFVPLALQGSIWNISPFFGIDYGGGRDYGLSHNDQIAGIAFGVNYYWKALSFSITLSHPILISKDMPKEIMPIYFNLSVSL